MQIAVRYFTKSGNTQKLAAALADSLDLRAADVSEDLPERADILFLGSSLYAGSYNPAIEEFVQRNRDKIGTVVLFGSSASGKSSAPKLMSFLEAQGVHCYGGTFQCLGHFLVLHKNRPNEKDFADLTAFAKAVCEKLGA